MVEVGYSTHMLNSDNGGGEAPAYQRAHDRAELSLVEQQVLVAATAAALGWEYEILNPVASPDGQWRGVDDDHGED